MALENKSHRPIIDDSLDIEITEGRHPVIERELPPGEPYITNSVRLSNSGPQIMMITGPNMSGKSALLRQTALNVIMAQIGCFVAADSARIGVVDKVFTSCPAVNNIPNILKKAYPAAQEGQYVIVNYNNASVDPAVGEKLFELTSLLGSAATGQNLTVNGYVSALDTQGFILTDNTGSIYCYRGNGFNDGSVK